MKFLNDPTRPLNNIGQPYNNRIGRGFRHDTTFNAGDLVPLFATHVLPGDDLSLNIATLLRTTSPPLTQTMDYLLLDVYAFYVSNYNLMEWGGTGRSDATDNSWTRFMGEDKNGNFIRTSQGRSMAKLKTFTVKQLTSDPVVYFNQPQLSDYLFQSTASVIGTVNRFKHLAYRQFWNEYCRDWNFQPEVSCNYNYANTPPNTINAVTRDMETGQLPIAYEAFDQILPMNRLDDYFSRAVPSPQKFSGIFTTSSAGLPVFAGENFNTFLQRVGYGGSMYASGQIAGHNLSDLDHPNNGVPKNNNYVNFNTVAGDTPVTTPRFIGINNYGQLTHSQSTAFDGTSPVYFSNLYAGRINTDWIRELERCYMLYSLYEINARSATYRDLIKNLFGVVPSNISLNRPTLLGSQRWRITPTQVENVGQSEQLGDIGAYVKASNNGHLFSQSFDDYGILMVVACVRPHRSYQQGMHREDMKVYAEEFFTTPMNALPYQPIYKDEIWQSQQYGLNSISPIFGWRPAWDEYQFFPDQKTGQFRSVLGANSLDYWHYADWYDTGVNLSSSWLVQGPGEVERTLSVRSFGDAPVAHQFMLESFFELQGRRPVSFSIHEKGRKL